VSEVQELPQGWVSAKLGVITKINPGIDAMGIDDGTLVSFVPMGMVEAGTGYLDATTRRPLRDVRRGYTAFKENDVLFAKITPCMENGKSAVARLLFSGIGYGSTEFHVLRPLSGINSSLIYFYISQEAFRRNAKRVMTGSAGQLRVPASYLNDIVFPLPSPSEQQRIVEALEQQLSRLDAGVAALRSVQQKLKRYRASVLKAAVEGKLTEEWRKIHPEVEPAPELLKRILQERRAKWEEEQIAKGRDPQKVKYEEPVGPDVKGLSELPVGWCWATVEQISWFARYGTSAKTTDDSTGIPVLRMGNIQEGVLDISKLKYLAYDHDEFPNLFLQRNDLLFNRTNSPELVGKSAVYKGILSPCSYASYLISVRFVQDHLSNYVCFFLNSIYGRIWIASVVSQQVGQANVNGTKLLALTFPLPSLAEQEQIVSLVEERLSIVSTLESTIEQVLKRAERMRQSILHRAFTGKLVAQDPNDEPASVLLERIQREREEAAAPQKLKRLLYKERGKSSGRRVAESTQPYLLLDVPEPEPVDTEATTQGKLWD
jgi:type I restriction enzyme S subunit